MIGRTPEWARGPWWDEFWAVIENHVFRRTRPDGEFSAVMYDRLLGLIRGVPVE